MKFRLFRNSRSFDVINGGDVEARQSRAAPRPSYRAFEPPPDLSRPSNHLTWPLSGESPLTPSSHLPPSIPEENNVMGRCLSKTPKPTAPPPPSTAVPTARNSNQNSNLEHAVESRNSVKNDNDGSRNSEELNGNQIPTVPSTVPSTDTNGNSPSEEHDQFAENKPMVENPEKEIQHRKKLGVSGESHRLEAKNASEIKVEQIVKDAASQELISKGLRQNQFLAMVFESSELVQDVVNAMDLKTFPSGSHIIRQGESGDELYVVAKGQLDVIRDNQKVNTLKPGTVFGEIAVLYRTPRNATIIATTNCDLWAIHRRIFHRILMKAALKRREENVRFLRSVPLLQKLDELTLGKISDLLKVEYYQPETPIIKEGDEGSTFYIISAGSVVVTKRQTDGTEKQLTVLNKGDFFGEIALLENEKRKATVRALSSSTECLYLEREPFIELLGPLDALRDTEWNQPAPTVNHPAESISNFSLEPQYKDLKLKDLTHINTLGVGGFGRVELVREGDTKNYFALKSLKKYQVVEAQQQEHAFCEKEIMISCRSPFIARMYKTYRDPKRLYMLMEVCMGGDVWSLLQKWVKFPEPIARFMVGCVVLGFEYLHARNVVYRDLKPENLMLDTKGYVKLVDFGFAKNIGTEKTWTFVGTPEYLAPEIIRGKGHDRAVDYWALGIFIHELLAGRPPFRGVDHMKTYNLILRGIDHLPMPTSLIRPRAIRLIKQLCRPVAVDRLGYQKNGINDIKNHSWFEHFDWDSLSRTDMAAPHEIVPRVNDPSDLRNFERHSPDRDNPPDDNTGWDINF